MIRKLELNKEKEVKKIENLSMMTADGCWDKYPIKISEDKLFEIKYESEKFRYFIREDEDGEHFLYRKKRIEKEEE